MNEEVEMNVEVEAVTGFEHNDTRSKGDRFSVSDQHAQRLEQAGLVKIVGDAPNAEPKGPAKPRRQKAEKPEGEK